MMRKRKRQSGNTVLVYALAETPGVYRYVGQTRCKPNIRLSFHKKDARRCAKGVRPITPVQAWLADMLARDVLPLMTVLDMNGIWNISEAVWIDRLRRAGYDLLNVNNLVELNDAFETRLQREDLGCPA